MKINIDIKNKVQAKLLEERSEGMFMGKMIPRDEWIAAVTNLIYNDRQLVLDQFKTKIGDILWMKNPLEIARVWEAFFSEILGNSTTQIMTIADLSTKGLGDINLGQDELSFVGLDAHGKAVLNAANTEVKTTIKKQDISSALNKHWVGMNQTIMHDKIPQNLYPHFFIYKKIKDTNHGVWRNYDKKNHKWKKDIFYWKHMYSNIENNLPKGDYANNIQKLGQAADSFLTHLGTHHSQLFTSVLEKSSAVLQFNQSVLAEEGDEGFFYLLMGGRNNVALTGGQDLILTDKNGTVIANIQLKTSKAQVNANYNTGALKRALITFQSILVSETCDYDQIKQLVTELYDNKQYGFGNFSIKLAQAVSTNVLDNLSINLQ